MAGVEERLGYRFHRRELLERALTHRSFASEQGSEEHYERLEWLGDAVLKLVTAELLFDRYPDEREGDLSKRVNHLVSEPVLAAWAAALGVSGELKLGVGEEKGGGRGKDSLLADSLEALFGAIYLDGGLEKARAAVRPMLDQALAADAAVLHSDSKTALQELTQARGWDLPDYRLVGESGPDHEKHFAVECWVAGACAGRGEGSSKKLAQQQAAADALRRLQNADDELSS
ncbi:MAG TPA: ribonuclease III [Thermoanaerobaculia bacterium]